jgi:hypothetical protein
MHRPPYINVIETMMIYFRNKKLIVKFGVCIYFSKKTSQGPHSFLEDGGGTST